MKTVQAQRNDPVTAGTDLFGHVPAPDIELTTTPSKASATRPQPKSRIAPKRPISPLSEESDDSSDEAFPINLEPAESDSVDTCLAKRMIDRMIADLNGRKAQNAGDLFGHIGGDRETCKLDALIWMYDLNPDGSAVPFEWVCNEIGLDHEAMRRITARSVRDDLKRILKILTGFFGIEHAKACEYKLSDYVNLTGWNPH